MGCGDVRLATAASRGIDPRDVAHTLHDALERGLRLVDVSEEPDAERLCADAIRSLRLRDTAVLATRVAPVPPQPGRPNRDVLPERLPARYVQERVEASLRTTKLDVLPLVQLPIHAGYRASSAWPELAGTCARMINEGKALAYAAALDAPGTAEELEAEAWLAAFAIEYSLCARSAAPLLDKPRPILARHPLAGAALAGTVGPGMKLSPNDDRRALDEPALERIATLVATLAPLVTHEPAAARSCEAAKAALDRGKRPDHVEAKTLAELALRYVCDRAIALPRLHARDYIDDAIRAAAAPPLSQALRDRIDALTP